ncbi:MAG: biotin carboxylase [Bacteroidetes bacterium RIFCSPLOWO2_12_FULL_37_12]|nr:MAG: biotin carboxylase [Bacteroidetes bacterium RIFCSPLOWO2_12_FULL_37_12]
MKLTIGVTGLNATDNPGSGVPVIRAIREDKSLNARIIGLSYENMEHGIYLKNLIDKTYHIPLPSSGSDTLLQRLAYIHSVEKLDIIIPNYDAELPNFIKIKDQLTDEGIRTYLPDKEIFEARHKNKLFEFGKKYGIKVPKSKTLFKVNEITGLMSEFNFPMVVKGKFYEAYIAYTFEQVHTYYHKLAAKWGLPVIIQEFIAGNEYDVVALGDGTGKTIGAIPMKKMVLTDKGKAWAGITINDKNILSMAYKLIKATKWKSGMELELMKSEKDELYLIEINPRFPAWVYLSAGAGQNLPAALVKLAMGKKVKPFKKYKTGKMFVRYSMDNVCDIKDFEKISTLGEY